MMRLLAVLLILLASPLYGDVKTSTDTFTFNEKFMMWGEPPKYRCKVHGEIGGATVYIRIDNDESIEESIFCGKCFKGFIENNVERAERIETSNAYTCSTCGRRFERGEGRHSCAVFHPAGHCCHFGESEIKEVP